MKVFCCKVAPDQWAGGIILVAADSRNEAFSIAAKDPNTFVHFEFKDKKGRLVDDWHQAARITSKLYPIEKWFQVLELIANVDTPRVLMEETTYVG